MSILHINTYVTTILESDALHYDIFTILNRQQWAFQYRNLQIIHLFIGKINIHLPPCGIHYIFTRFVQFFQQIQGEPLTPRRSGHKAIYRMLCRMNSFPQCVYPCHTNHIIGITMCKISAYPHILYISPMRRTLFGITKYGIRCFLPIFSNARFIYFTNQYGRVIRPTRNMQRLSICKNFSPCRLARTSESSGVQISHSYSKFF